MKTKKLDSDKDKIFKECANCGDVTDNFCIIQDCTREENWIEYVWVKLGMVGKPICAECYYK